MHACDIAPIHLFGQRPWGFGTGGWYEESTDPQELVELCLYPLRFSSAVHALEATCQTSQELELWQQWFLRHSGKGPAPVLWSVHAPSKGLTQYRKEHQKSPFDSLASLPLWAGNIVVHPDVLEESDFEALAKLGSRLLLENMDQRKRSARTVVEMQEWFERFPHAGFCLDLAHANTVDPTGHLAISLAKTFGDRLRQLHVSAVEKDGHHLPITGLNDLAPYGPILDNIEASVPVILESKLATDDLPFDKS